MVFIHFSTMTSSLLPYKNVYNTILSRSLKINKIICIYNIGEGSDNKSNEEKEYSVFIVEVTHSLDLLCVDKKND